MTENPSRFAELLTQAIYQIKTQNKGLKTIEAIQDELGLELGRTGGSFINWLRKGHLPANLHDAESLARKLVLRGGFVDQKRCEQFLRSAGHPNPQEMVKDWFLSAGQEKANQIAMQRLKPFVVGPPTQLRQFFGRNRELQRIFNRWQEFPLEHLALVGPRRSGKTSLLHYLSQITRASATELRPGQRTDWLPDPEHYRWIFVDFQDPRMRQREKLLSHLLTAFDLPTPDSCNLETFMDLMTDQEWQKSIILMDELGAGLRDSDLDQSFWWALRSLVNTAAAGYLAFLVAGEDLPEHLADEQGRSSPFFNMFITLELGPFTEKEARELISSSPRPFAPEDVRWILEHSHLWPCLVQILCKERLVSLEHGISGDNWKEDGLRQIARYSYLWEGNS